MNTFRCDPDADTARTHFLGEITVPPRKLVDVFGPPEGGDDYKVSGSYTFTDEGGNVFTVYDWKATSLYDDGLEPGEESSFPTPDEFWGNWNPDVLHIGGRDTGDLEAFRRWLTDRLG